MDKKDKSDCLRNSTNSMEVNNGKNSKLPDISAYRHSLTLPEKRKKLIRQKRIHESEDNTGLNQTRGIVVNQEEKCSVLNGNILDYRFILIHIFCITNFQLKSTLIHFCF